MPKIASHCLAVISCDSGNAWFSWAVVKGSELDLWVCWGHGARVRERGELGPGPWPRAGGELTAEAREPLCLGGLRCQWVHSWAGSPAPGSDCDEWTGDRAPVTVILQPCWLRTSPVGTGLIRERFLDSLLSKRFPNIIFKTSLYAKVFLPKYEHKQK